MASIAMTSTPHPEVATALRRVVEQQGVAHVTDVAAASAVSPVVADQTCHALVRRGDLVHLGRGRFRHTHDQSAPGGDGAP